MMQEKIIDRDKAVQTIKLWQDAARAVEVRLRFTQGITQTHPGYVTLEPDGRIVVAHVIDRNHYFTTVIELSTFNEIKLIESESAIIFAEPWEGSGTFESVMIACRQQAEVD
jgi:hypothetical protein